MITNEELKELFQDATTREAQLEIALRQMLCVFDSPIARRHFKAEAYEEAIKVARHIMPYEAPAQTLY
jgi:hypothetical protein